MILANAMESLIGAIYLDGGQDAARAFVNQFILEHLEEVLKAGSYRDSKSLLQEKVQEKMKVTPVYQVLSQTGPDHAKIFNVGVYFGEKLIAKGEGSSKQEAEEAAAKEALANL